MSNTNRAFKARTVGNSSSDSLNHIVRDGREDPGQHCGLGQVISADHDGIMFMITGKIRGKFPIKCGT